MKKILLLLASLALMSCSDPKSLTIPQDLTKIADDKQFIEQVKSMPAEEKDLLTGYLARAAISKALLNQDNQLGMTVGEAIDQQRRWLKEQETIKLAEQEAQKAALAELEKNNALLRDALQIVYVKRGQLTEQNYRTYLPIYFHITNKSGKQVAGFKANAEFRDQFGELIKTVDLQDSHGLPADFDKTVSFMWQYNQFDNDWNQLLSLDDGKFSAAVQTTHLIFDGGEQLKSQ